MIDGSADTRLGLVVEIDAKALVRKELVNKFELGVMKGRCLSWGISQPPRHSAVNGDFTMILRSFIFIEHLEKPPEGSQPR
ncbi:UNVERIFIED_ORG: hypothetical protein GGI61_002492 [Rhizobium esperanzae]